jgi:hypothetical protein
MEDAGDVSEGRPVALRLTLTGTPDLHSWLHGNRPHWTEECRAIAAALGNVWLEKIILDTRRNDPGTTLDEGSPLAGLVESIQKLDLDQNFYDRIPELAELQAKLPPELSDGDNLFDLSGSEHRDRWQKNVRDLVLSRLLSQERGL